MSRHPHPWLVRLDALAEHLSHRRDVVAVLGLGSAGRETERFDDHSDLDVFVVVDDGAQQRYVDGTDWLEAAGPVAWSFRHEPNGRKVLYEGGLFVELAVFSVAELARIPFTGGRVVWQRHDAPHDLLDTAAGPQGPPFDTVELHLGEAVTNLYVGLHRELRGERLTASRFIQVHAVDRAISLLRLTGSSPALRDVFDASRRVEGAFAPEVLPLARLVPGYEHNVPAATAMLAWLRDRFDVDPGVGGAVDALIERCST